MAAIYKLRDEGFKTLPESDITLEEYEDAVKEFDFSNRSQSNTPPKKNKKVEKDAFRYINCQNWSSAYKIGSLVDLVVGVHY